MGTGTITLWWYALCCAFVTIFVITTSVLIALGQRKRARKLAERTRTTPATDRETDDDPS